MPNATSEPHFSLALVTGATSGIGLALCRLLASKKIPLMISGRNQQRLAQTAEALKKDTSIIAVRADLSIPAEQQLLIDKVHEHKPDLVINNAGFGFYGEALSYDLKDHLELLTVNGQAVIALTLEAARTLIAAGKRGVILNVSSAASKLIFPRFASYAASKALVTNFSQAFDYEVSPLGIRVLTACPGVVATHFRQTASQHTTGRAKRRPAMSADQAANLIWWQIVKGKRIYVFDWKTRLPMLFARCFLPARTFASILSNEIKKIAPSRSLKL